MTVKELIERLNAMDPDRVVFVKDPGYDGDWSWDVVTEVEASEDSIYVIDPETGRGGFKKVPSVNIYV